MRHTLVCAILKRMASNMHGSGLRGGYVITYAAYFVDFEGLCWYS